MQTPWKSTVWILQIVRAGKLAKSQKENTRPSSLRGDEKREEGSSGKLPIRVTLFLLE